MQTTFWVASVETSNSTTSGKTIWNYKVFTNKDDADEWAKEEAYDPYTPLSSSVEEMSIENALTYLFNRVGRL